MKLINNLLDYSKKWALPDIYLFTGNAIIKNNGAIVMGRGAAKQVRDSYPGIDKVFGAEIEQKPDAHIVFVQAPPNQMLGWFKVKYHWREEAKIDLIRESVQQLKVIAEARTEVTFHMNYPGVGNGRLDIQLVRPVLEELPDNVLIYR